jgi:anti-anti-sigma regulatory factor/HAMP domain-containing protein
MNHGPSQQRRSPSPLVRWTLASKIILSIGGLLILLAIGVAALTFVQVRQSALDQLEGKGSALTDSLNYTFEVLLGQDAVPSLQRVAENSATIPDVRKLLIADRAQQVVASSDHLDIGKPTTSALLRTYLEQANWQRITSLTADNELIIIQPLRGGRFVGGVNGDIIGAVQVTLERQGADATALRAALQLLGIILGSYLLICALLVFVLRILVVRPLHQFAVVAQRIRAGDRSLRSRIYRRDEIGLLSTTFDDMANEVETMVNSLEAQVAGRTAALETVLAEVQSRAAEQERLLAENAQQRDLIRELSVPVLPISASMLVMPLIGALDTTRLQHLREQALRAIERTAARYLLLDITGVPVVDSQVAQGIIAVVRAARLLGAEVVLIGIRPEVAQAIVVLGLDVQGLRTAADLRTALSDYATARSVRMG